MPVYIVHLSSRDALDEIVRGRDRGAMAFGETCPQYLFLSLDDMGNGFEGAKFVCSPPLRPATTRRTLWRGPGAGRPPDPWAPTTAPSTSTARRSSAEATSARSPTVCQGSRSAWTSCTRASCEGRYSRERWVEVTSTAAARIFGLGGAQGRHRARLRRRHRRLRPGAPARPLCLDAPHGRRLLLLRGPRGTGRQRHRPLAWQGHRRGRRIRGTKGDGRFLKRETAREYLR